METRLYGSLTGSEMLNGLPAGEVRRNPFNSRAHILRRLRFEFGGITMCGRFYIPEDERVRMIRAILENTDYRDITVKAGDIRPGDTAAVVACNKEMTPRPFAMEWGFRLPGGRRVFNVRSETAGRRPMFADGMKHRRCLIPALHYYEWEKTPRGKVKYAIAPENADGFFLAGIYRLEQGVPVFSVLTKQPAESIAFIHDRMPVILPYEVMYDWLNPRCRGDDLLRSAVGDMTYRVCESPA